MQETTSVYVGHLTVWPQGTLSSTTKDGGNNLIVLQLCVKGMNRPLRALLDSGALDNFIRTRSLGWLPPKCWSKKVIPSTKMEIRLATGSKIEADKRVVKLCYSLMKQQLDDEFIVLEMDSRYDAILGMPWLTARCPVVDWAARSRHNCRPEGRLRAVD